MVQVIEQTHDEKLKMYMKLPKKELAEMLINCNFILEHYFKQLNKHNVVRVGDNEAVSCQVTTTPNGTDITYANPPSTPTEQLNNEGMAKSVSEGKVINMQERERQEIYKKILKRGEPSA